MNKWSKDEIAKIMLEVKKKAITDGEFRKLCLDNSVEAIKVISEKEFPAEIKIKFINKTIQCSVFLLIFHYFPFRHIPKILSAFNQIKG